MMMENKQEGGFFTIGKDNNSSSSTQQQYLDKFSSALQSAENQMGQQPMQQNAATDNSLVDKKPGSFLF